MNEEDQRMSTSSSLTRAPSPTLFSIDTERTDGSRRVRSNLSTAEILTYKVTTPGNSVPESSKCIKFLCFNCRGNHIRDFCPHPRNQSATRKSWSEFRAALQPRSVPIVSTRYRPGLISRKLRAALGLQERDLPPWTYRMREQGYPPTYLKEAAIYDTGDPTNLLSFHFLDNEQNEEEDRKERLHLLQPPTLDPEKIIKYVGFTAEIPHDEHYGTSFQVPPFHLVVSKLQDDLRKKWRDDIKSRSRDRRTFGKADREAGV
ncbi:hypothetical protein QR680_000484 [Steinernema hermaphroditum]|uniref:PSP proline-rich domain-containing protein n=1 Tax=Steinernema hermaphroditum TaxID=289476 RepID=A0AA39GVI1_9BILA|nr:hypothetical protein QR680_000484 [Steinernema hermaphroditum]